MQKIPGKKIANDILEKAKQTIQENNLQPKLAVLLVGEDPASHLYVSLKEKAAHQAGLQTEIHRLPAETSDEELIQTLTGWNSDPKIDGILIQLPLPPNHDTNRVVTTMDPKKDADGFHPENVSALKNGEATILSPLHEGILRLIGATDIAPNHAKVILLVNSETFADPLKYMLEKAGATVEICNAQQKDDKKLREADIIISAIGQPGIIHANSVRNGSCVIDVGISKDANGKTCGDFDPKETEEIQGWYSPVPGGVGPMTVALLIKNTVQLALQKKQVANRE